MRRLSQRRIDAAFGLGFCLVLGWGLRGRTIGIEDAAWSGVYVCLMGLLTVGRFTVSWVYVRGGGLLWVMELDEASGRDCGSPTEQVINKQVKYIWK
ncbi:hypothetical protein QBC41DRAFT_310056 [Cercophora samala]|uniref:Transmembrane protein n=1 Tax=Cercophora samala TaxID=330535 RepID=A0AA39ZMM5_9PEZI|nr:hypothetical protein QBC41DRAFT_310056 [Cercophora samala]